MMIEESPSKVYDIEKEQLKNIKILNIYLNKNLKVGVNVF